jgi:thimet oligopeptidase
MHKRYVATNIFLSTLLLTLLVGCSAHHPTSRLESGSVPSQSQAGDEFAAWCDGQLGGMNHSAETLRNPDATRTARQTLDLFNDIEVFNDDSLSRSGLYQLNHPDAGVREAAMNCEQRINNRFTELMLDPDLYAALANVDASDDQLDALDRRYLEKVLKDFRRNGVDQPVEVRKKVIALNRSMVELSQAFDKNLAEDTRYVEVRDDVRLAGLPQDFIDAHPADENGVRRISTDWPDYYPVMIYADDESLRKELWLLNWNLGYPQNVNVLNQLLETRYELAHTLGYANWAAYSTELMMIKTPENAHEFIDRAFALSKPIGEKELSELLALKQRMQPEATQVNAWERGYLTRLLTSERYQYDPEVVRSYFALDKVQAGLLALSERLYGIKFQKVAEAETWHPDVQAFDVTQDGKSLGRIYLDLYPRENKYKSFAMFSVVSGVEGRRLPEMAIVGNFADPSKHDGPTLIDHLDVETFFHEFGHLMHGLLGGNSHYVRFSGVSAEWDFVEVPSQLYEEWTWDASALATFATNQAGEAIPADLVERLHASQDFGKGLFVMQQMFYAAISLGIYDRAPDGFDPNQFAEELQAQYSPWHVMPETHFIMGFSHLIGYSSNYYTYMWSLVIEKDVFARFAQRSLIDSTVAMEYRRIILDSGGTRDAADMLTDFLGRPFSFDAYEQWLEK